MVLVPAVAPLQLHLLSTPWQPLLLVARRLVALMKAAVLLQL